MSTILKVKITFITPVLGSAPADTEIYNTYIAANSPNAGEEAACIPDEKFDIKGKTVFLRDADGNPLLWDYQIRGFFKHACGIIKLANTKSASAKIKAYKKYIDGMVFVYGAGKDGSVKPDEMRRKIPINYDGEIGDLQRSLRADTAQGPRVSLANSEKIEAGAYAYFYIDLLNDDMQKAVMEWLDYGKYNGLGQWRNGSYGRFTYEIVEE